MLHPDRKWSMHFLKGGCMAARISVTNRNRIKGYAFLLPNILGFAVFTLFPVAASLLISFTDWDGFGKIRFIGLTNYLGIFSDEGFMISLKNSMIYTIFFVPLTLALALLVAIALNNGMKGVKLYRTAFFLPYISATIAVAVVWQLLYHPTLGPLNGFLKGIGISSPPQWLSSTKWAMTAVIVASIWKSTGYYMIIFLAGLQGIPKHLYEASDIDGANSFQKFRNVMLPMLSPVIFFTVIMGIINSFKVFDIVYALTGGGPARATNVLVYTIYDMAFGRYQFGPASAMAYVLFAIILIITAVQFRGQKKWVNYA